METLEHYVLAKWEIQKKQTTTFIIKIQCFTELLGMGGYKEEVIRNLYHMLAGPMRGEVQTVHQYGAQRAKKGPVNL